ADREEAARERAEARRDRSKSADNLKLATTDELTGARTRKLCAMPNLSVREARARFEKIAAVLAAVDADHSVTFGLAEAEPADSLQELIARADADFLEARRSPTRND